MEKREDLLPLLAEYGLRSGAAVYAKGQEQARHILEQAIAILSEQGPKGLTMRALARKCDIPLSVLQHYFRGRQDVLKAVVRYMGHSYLYESKLIFENETLTFPQQIEELLSQTFQMANFASITCALYGEAQTQTKEIAPLLQEIHADILAVVDNAYSKERPDLDAEKRKDRLVFMFASLEGLGLFLAKDPPMASNSQNLPYASRNFLIHILMDR